MAESEAGSVSGSWPAAIVHVNEDGWVLLNRGAEQGVAPGMGLLVVGDAERELYDTGTGAAASADTEPRTLLRIRRTYELLEVVYADEQCAIAIAARVPPQRRPQVYRAPGGELLVWVPLPPEYTWPGSAASDEADTDEDTADEQESDDGADEMDAPADEDQEEDQQEEADTPDVESLAEEQEDERWEQALPLNGLHVGDLVLPAIPVSTGAGGHADD